MAKNKKDLQQKNQPIVNKNEVAATIPVEYPIAEPFLKANLWKVILFCLLGFAIYYKTASYGYVLDDTIVVAENNFVKKGFSGIGDILTTETMTGYFEEQKNLVQGNRYRPLSLISFAIENGIIMAANPDSNVVKAENPQNPTSKDKKGQIRSDKMKPGISHIINILLYILSCIVIMRSLQLLFQNRNQSILGYFDLSFFVALLYLVHPLHVEAVANIKGRDEILAMLFSMASLYALTKHYIYGKSVKYLYFGLVSYFLGLLSKENAITFAAIIPLSIYFFGDKFKSKSLNSFIWLVLVSILYLFIRFQAAGVPKLDEKITDIMNNPFLDMNVGEKLATVIYTLGMYIKLLFIPYPLTHDYYPYAIPIMHFSDWQVLLSLAFYGILTYFGFKSIKTIGGYGISFYLITLSIVSNLVINLGTFMNDRFIYMPSLGYCLLLTWAVFHFGNKIKSGAAPIKAVLLLVPILVYAALSFIRVPDWANAMTLNKSSLKVSQNSARANSFMSTALFEEYKVTEDPQKKRALLTEALPYAKKAIEIIPNYYNANLMAVGIAGELHKLDGDLNKLFSVFEPCITNRPNIQFTTDYLKYINPIVADRNTMINFYVKVGQNLMNKNNVDDTKWAIHYMRLGLEVDPENKTLNNNIYKCFTTLGDLDQARHYLK
jgi:protein O-mannosyl-transferase